MPTIIVAHFTVLQDSYKQRLVCHLFLTFTNMDHQDYKYITLLNIKMEAS
jgi:hypothetical protein